jgi:WD40 repeat protein
MLREEREQILRELQQAKINRQKQLAVFERELSILAHAPQKFELQQRIQECKEEIEKIDKKIEKINEEIRKIDLLVKECINMTQAECPYQGLEPFTKDKAQFFFGRDSEVELLRNQLNEHNLIFVVGSSGVGKSSFIQAGLVPSLEQKGWKILKLIKPGLNPINKLQEIFEDFFRDNGQLARFEKWYENLISATANSENLVSLLENLAGTQKLLLVVDQFEEIFTICTNQEQRSSFLNLLYQFAIASSRLFIIVNMRTDFGFLLNTYPETSRLYQNRTIGIHFLSRLQGENLTAAIIQPVRKQGYEFGEGLLELILRDVDEENCLPLLQFTLKELWECGVQDTQNKQLLIKHYINIGGLKGSLNLRADEIYKRLETDLQREVAERLFLSLVQTNKDTRDTRKRQREENILNIGGTDEERQAINDVLNRFVDERLLVRDGQWVDIAHETLMEAWQKFKEWRTKDRDLRRLIERIREAFQEWKIHEKEVDFLLSTSLIIQLEAITLLPEQRHELEKELRPGSDLKNFFDISIENHKKSQLAQAQNLEREARETQEKLNSSNPMSGLMQTIQLINKCLNSRPLSSNLPGSVQNALRLAMETSREQNCFVGHEDRVKCVAISHNRKWIVSGSEDKTLRLWNSKGSCCAVFEGHESSIWSVAFSPDDSWIVSGSADNTLRRWKLDEEAIDARSIVKGEPIGEPFVGHEDWVRSVVISPDGNLIVSGSKDKTVRLWDLEGKLICQFPKEHTDWIFSIAIWQDLEDLDKSFIVSGSVDSTIRRWNLKGQPIGEPFNGHEGWVRSVAVTNNGKWIVSGSEDKTIRLWDLNGNCIKVFEGHENRVLSVAVWQDPKSSDGEDIGFIVSGSADHTIRLWNFNGDLIGKPLKGHTDWVRDIKVSIDGKFIASSSRDKTVRLWSTGKSLIGQPFGKQSGRILSVAFSSQGNLIVSGGEDKKIYLWNCDGTLKNKFGEHDDWIRSVRILPGDKYIVSGSADRKLRLWDLDGTLVKTQDDGHNSWIRSITVSPDGNYIVSSSNDKTLCLWKVNKLKSDESERDRIFLEKLQCFAQKHNREVLCVAFSPDSKLIVSCSADKTIRLWDLNGNIKTEKTAFQAHKDRVLSVAFSPDSRYIVSASYDHTICLWNVEGEKIWQKKLEDKVRCVAFSPIEEFPLIVSGSCDGTIQFWNVEGYAIGNPLKGHQDVIRSVKFSPDGKSIISASEDGTLRKWKAGNWKDWLKVCCERVYYHPSLQEPNSEVAREAREICRKLLEERI